MILRSGRAIERNDVWPPRPERPRRGGEKNLRSTDGEARGGVFHAGVRADVRLMRGGIAPQVRLFWAFWHFLVVVLCAFSSTLI